MYYYAEDDPPPRVKEHRIKLNDLLFQISEDVRPPREIGIHIHREIGYYHELTKELDYDTFTNEQV